MKQFYEKPVLLIMGVSQGGPVCTSGTIENLSEKNYDFDWSDSNY